MHAVVPTQEYHLSTYVNANLNPILVGRRVETKAWEGKFALIFEKKCWNKWKSLCILIES